MHDSKKLIIGVCLWILLHFMVWWCTNLQFVKDYWRENAIYVALVLAIPITLAGFFATRFTYEGLGNTLWGARFIAFGTSYLIFPVLTWLVLKESMFTTKTLLCILLSFLIITIQVFWK
mgnify:FL=1